MALFRLTRGFDSLDSWRSEDNWSGSSVVFGTPGEDDPQIGDLGGRQRPGDSNQDGLVDLSDPLHLLQRLFVGGISLPCEGDLQSGGNLAVLDVSGDDTVNLSDAVYLVNYLFKGGDAPVLGQSCTRVQGCPSISCGL